MEEALATLGNVRLVIFDPITSYLGRHVNSHRNAEVRSVLEPVAELSARYRVASLVVRFHSSNHMPTRPDAARCHCGMRTWKNCWRAADMIDFMESIV